MLLRKNHRKLHPSPLQIQDPTRRLEREVPSTGHQDIAVKQGTTSPQHKTTDSNEELQLGNYAYLNNNNQVASEEQKEQGKAEYEEVEEKDVHDENDDEIRTLSTSGSDVDYAILESSNLLAVIEEESATDEDQDVIPVDNIPLKTEIDYLEGLPISTLQDYSTEQQFSSYNYLHYPETVVSSTSSSMESDLRKLPVIAVTSDSDSRTSCDGLQNTDENKSSLVSETLTDVEDLLSETEDCKLPVTSDYRSLIIKNNDEIVAVTEDESVEISDEDVGGSVDPNYPSSIDRFLEIEGTVEELVKYTGGDRDLRMKCIRVTEKLSESALMFATSTSDEQIKNGLTDFEEVQISDDDILSDKSEEFASSCALTQLISEGDSVEISDTVKHLSDVATSPAVTPEPQNLSDYVTKASTKLRKGKSLTKMHQYSKPKQKTAFKTHLGSSFLPLALNIAGEGEVLSSDSDTDVATKDGKSNQLRRRRPKSPGMRHQTGLLTDIEDIEISDYEGTEKRISPSNAPVQYILNTQLPKEKCFTETENSLHSSKIKGTLKTRDGSPFPDIKITQETTTDIEDCEVLSEEDSILYNDKECISFQDCGLENTYESVTETHHVIEKIPKKEQYLDYAGALDYCSNEDLNTGNNLKMRRLKNFKPSPDKGSSTEEDDCEVSDGDTHVQKNCDEVVGIKFLDIAGEHLPVIVPSDDEGQDKATSEKAIHLAEELDCVGCSSEIALQLCRKDTILSISDESFNIVAPTTTDSETDCEMKYMSVSESTNLGKSHHKHFSVPSIPVNDLQCDSCLKTEKEFKSTVNENEGGTDQMYTDSHYTGSSDEIQAEKGRNTLNADATDLEILTETEEVFLTDVSTLNKRKKSRTKSVAMKSRSHLSSHMTMASDFCAGTDTEEIVLSDQDDLLTTKSQHIQQESFLSGVSTMDTKTDVEDMEVSDGEVDGTVIQVMTHERPLSVTPDIMRDYGLQTVTLKEGDGPFSHEVREQISTSADTLIPVIRMMSPTSDIFHSAHTDTEDVVASADEEASYSRAETMTPMEMHRYLEDQTSSVVHDKHTRKFDLEAPQEAIHVKGSFDIRESQTDVEDFGFSEEEYHKSEHPEDKLTILDGETNVCVCVSSKRTDCLQNDSVCVCVGKLHGELTVVWQNENSTLPVPNQTDWNICEDAEDKRDVSQGIKQEQDKPADEQGEESLAQSGTSQGEHPSMEMQDAGDRTSSPTISSSAPEVDKKDSTGDKRTQ